MLETFLALQMLGCLGYFAISFRFCFALSKSCPFLFILQRIISVVYSISFLSETWNLTQPWGWEGQLVLSVKGILTLVRIIDDCFTFNQERHEEQCCFLSGKTNSMPIFAWFTAMRGLILSSQQGWLYFSRNSLNPTLRGWATTVCFSTRLS